MERPGDIRNSGFDQLVVKTSEMIVLEVFVSSHAPSAVLGAGIDE